jgi:hypothetical protein
MNSTTKLLPSAFIAAVLAATLLAGCATSASDCGPDWYAIGQRDGRLGAVPQDQYYAARCAAPVDHAQYFSGWEVGYAQRPLPGW